MERTKWLYSGVAILTSATLILELTLTRIFSVIMFYHFAFLAISLALFGLGFAGIFVYLRPQLTEPKNLTKVLTYFGIAAAISTFIALPLILQQKINVSLGQQNFKSLTIIYVSAALPFFFAGVVLTAIIKRFQKDMGRLYFYDLFGAGAGCLLLPVLLALFGGLNCVLLAGILFLVSILCFQMGLEETAGLRANVITALVLTGALFGLNISSPFIHIPSVKETLEKRVIFSKWNSFSRVTVEKTPRHYYWIKMDSSAATRIYSKRAFQQKERYILNSRSIRLAGLVYTLRRKGKSLIIGPGGGTDVIMALAFGQKNVVGVELNPIIVDLMKNRFRKYNGGLYKHQNVKVVAGEGRSFIRSSKDKYGSIQATMVDTWAATAAGAFSLSENTLYTRNAFREYLRHLTPEGVLTMYRWKHNPPREFLRLLVLSRAALDDHGIGNHAAHMYAASYRSSATFLLKKTPFTPAEIKGLDSYCRKYRFRILHSPGKPRNNTYSRLINAKSWKAFIKRYPLDISPVNDNRPFFFYTVKPKNLLKAASNIKKLNEHNRGLMMLLIALGLVTTLVLIFFIFPLFFFRRDVLAEDRMSKIRYLLYFFALGTAFITVEIALMQKFVLFLGHPTYALIVVLFSLLIASGIGSYLCRNVELEALGSTIKRNIALLTAIVVGYMFLLTPLFNLSMHLPLTLRMVLSALFLAPLGLYMGSLLPMGIKGAGERFGELVPWAWGINGAASVFGSVLSIILALHLGFNVTLCIGLGFYIFGLFTVSDLLTPSSEPAKESTTKDEEEQETDEAKEASEAKEQDQPESEQEAEKQAEPEKTAKEEQASADTEAKAETAKE